VDKSPKKQQQRTGCVFFFLLFELIFVCLKNICSLGLNENQ